MGAFLFINFQDTYCHQWGILLTHIQILHGGKFHGLVFGHVPRRPVARQDDKGCGDQAENGRNEDASFGKLMFPVFQKIPGTYANDENRGEYIPG